MTIEARLQDGRVLRFPDGTSQEVIQNTVRSIISGKEQEDPGIGDKLLGAAEVAGTLATGAIAEPISGLAGIRAVAGGAEDPGQTVEQVQKALTFQPRTETGQQFLKKTGEFFKPVGDFFQRMEKSIGDTVFSKTGSPALSAAATTIPTAIVEILGGLGLGKGAVKATSKVKKALSEGKIAREISEAAPTIESLKEASRSIYKEIDDIGAVVKPDAFNSLVTRIDVETRGAGLDPRTTPRAAGALEVIKESIGTPVNTTELDRLRKVAQGVANAPDATEKSLGIRMINTIDEFLDTAGTSVIDAPPSAKIGQRYKAARGLWGRARKSELIQESFEKARLQASGFENGLRIQFRSILRNPKTRRFFSKSEQAALKRVVDGSKGENIAKLVGKLGFLEGGGQPRIVGPAIGIFAGGQLAGGPGAVIFPLVGQISRTLAQRMTAKNARFADQVIRAGNDANLITRAYMRNTPKAQRSANELAQLLMRDDIDLSKIKGEQIAQQAAEITNQRRAKLAGVMAAQAGEGIENE